VHAAKNLVRRVRRTSPYPGKNAGIAAHTRMCRPYLFQEGLDEQQRNQGTKVSNNSLFLRDFVVKIQAVRVISTNYNLLKPPGGTARGYTRPTVLRR
jgi:hypothetical protein